MYLPEMSDDWSIRPGMLRIQSHGAVLKNDQVKGFIEPSEWGEKSRRIYTYILYMNSYNDRIRYGCPPHLSQHFPWRRDFAQLTRDWSGLSDSKRCSVSSRVTQKAAFSMASRDCLFLPRLKQVSLALAHGVLQSNKQFIF